MLEERCGQGVVEVLEMLKDSMTLESLKEDRLATQVNAINITEDDINSIKTKIFGKNFK